MCSIPVRAVHSGRSRLRGARGASHDGEEPRPDTPLHRQSWSVRPCAPERNDGEIVGGARAPSPLAVCEVNLLPAFQIRVDGKTKRRTSMKFANTKGVNRWTLSCPSSSASPSTTQWTKRNKKCWMGRHCLRFRAMCTSCRAPSGRVICTTWWERNCGLWLAYNCTRGRRDVGIRTEGVLLQRSIFKSSGPAQQLCAHIGSVGFVYP